MLVRQFYRTFVKNLMVDMSGADVSKKRERPEAEDADQTVVTKTMKYNRDGQTDGSGSSASPEESNAVHSNGFTSTEASPITSTTETKTTEASTSVEIQSQTPDAALSTSSPVQSSSNMVGTNSNGNVNSNGNGNENPDDIVEETGNVSAVYVGRVIGKGGEMIRDLQARSGCRIDVDQNVPEGAPRVITYRGKRSSVALARQLIELLCRNREADMPLGEATRRFLEVPGDVIGKIIGRGGEMIRELQSKSQAKIQVDHSGGNGHPRKVTVTGTEQAVVKAEEMILFLTANPTMDANAALTMLIEDKSRHGGRWGSGPPYTNMPNGGRDMTGGGGPAGINYVHSQQPHSAHAHHTHNPHGHGHGQNHYGGGGGGGGGTYMGGGGGGAMGGYGGLQHPHQMHGPPNAGGGHPSHVHMPHPHSAQPHTQPPHHAYGGGGPGGGGLTNAHTGYHASNASAVYSYSGGGGGGAYPNPVAPSNGGGGAFDSDIFLCAKIYMGRVIGQKGVTVNDLQKRSGCDIQINQDVLPGRECEISIRGPRHGIESAKTMLREIIEMGPNHPYAGGRGGPHGGHGANGHNGAHTGGGPPSSSSHDLYHARPTYGGAPPVTTQPPPTYGYPTAYPPTTTYAAPYGGTGYGRPPPPPPPAATNPWKSATASDGQTYYYNEQTGETTWDKPPGLQ